MLITVLKLRQTPVLVLVQALQFRKRFPISSERNEENVYLLCTRC